MLLKELREEVGMSQQNAAEFLHLKHRTTVASWENGDKRPPARRRERFITYLLDGLRLQKRPRQLLKLWQSVMIEQWEWKPLAATELPRSFANFLQEISDDVSGAIQVETWLHRPNQLPRRSTTTVIGRSAEKKAVLYALHDEQKACALIGMGGIGKSTLALDIAHEVAHEFTDGILFARVVGENSLLGILGTFCEAFGRNVSDYGAVSDRSRIFREIISDKNALIVLDNVESVAELSPLLPASDSCTVLVTTRNHAIVRSQTITPILLETLDNEQSHALLHQHIGKRISENPLATQTILTLTAGLPLAIAIVSGTIKESNHITVAEVAQSLSDESERLNELTDFNDESLSVRLSLEMSYRRLSPALQALLAQLAVFDGLDFSVAAVAAVMQKSAAWVKRRLDTLVKRSLLDVSYSAENIPHTDTDLSHLNQRYRLHALVHLFAREKQFALDLDGRPATAVHYVELTERYANKESRWLDLDWGNISSAFQWAYQARQTDLLVRGVQGLTATQVDSVGYLDQRGECRIALEMLGWLDEVWQSADLTQADIWFKRGVFAFRIAQNDDAAVYWKRALELVMTLPQNEETALLLARLYEMQSRLWQDDETTFTRRLSLLTQAVVAMEGFETESARAQRGYLHVRRATIWAEHRGDLKRAREELALVQHLLPSMSNGAVVSTQNLLGNIAYLEQDYSTAEAHWLSAYERASTRNNARQTAYLCQNLGIVATAKGNYAVANRWYEEANRFYQHSGDQRGLARLLSNRVTDALPLGRFDHTLTLANNAIRIADTLELTEEKLFALVNRARCYIYLDDPNAAARDLEMARQINLRQQKVRWQAMILHVSAEIAYAQGDIARAEADIMEAINLGLDSDDLGVARRLQADCYAEMGRSVEAEATYATASESLEGINPYELTRTYINWARLRDKLGKCADDQLNVARSLCQQHQFTMLKAQLS